MKIKKELFETKKEDSPGVRINKFLADAGICSRREADAIIASGAVQIDGEIAVMGSRVLPGQKVMYKGKDITKIEDLVLIALNKPKGIVCTTDRRDPDNIIDFLSYEKRIFPIGRLDKDSEGLILLTNDGNIVNKILRAGNYHEKEYIVTVNKEITPEFLKKMGSGVQILDTVTRPCRIEQIDRFNFRIILTQGLNRQIRRMCEALDYRVRALTRVRIMNISLGRLKSGTYRNLTEAELIKLKELIANSSNAPLSGRELEMAGEFEDEINPVPLEAKKPVRKVTQRNNEKPGIKASRGNNERAGYKGTVRRNENGASKINKSKEVTNYDRKSGTPQKERKNPTADRTAFKGSSSLRAGRPRTDQQF